MTAPDLPATPENIALLQAEVADLQFQVDELNAEVARLRGLLRFHVGKDDF